jgi:hypothetical protein
MVIGRPKPDGTPYTNIDEDWLWLSGKAGKAARWLGYIPFDQIIDQRNADPVVREFEPPQPEPFLSVGARVDIPDVDDLVPEAELDGFTGAQPYKLVIVGEKSSLEDVLGPIASRFKADLYLPTGEISDTLLYRMACVAAADGREMVVLYFSDADPAGWQMPISVARKLQALKAGFCHFEFQVRRVALTPDQVREYGLPSTPLKDAERRGDRWVEAMGLEQTEIDALASLRPELLRQLARDAIEPFFDRTLDQRVADTRRSWLEQAQAAIDDQLDDATLDGIRQEATVRLGELREQIDALNAALRVSANDVELPELPVLPTPEVDGDDGLPLLASKWSFADQCRTLVDSKAYRS